MNEFIQQTHNLSNACMGLKGRAHVRTHENTVCTADNTNTPLCVCVCEHQATPTFTPSPFPVLPPSFVLTVFSGSLPCLPLPPARSLPTDLPHLEKPGVTALFPKKPRSSGL